MSIDVQIRGDLAGRVGEEDVPRINFNCIFYKVSFINFLHDPVASSHSLFGF